MCFALDDTLSQLILMQLYKEVNYFDKAAIKFVFSQSGLPWFLIGDHAVLFIILCRLL